MERLSAEVIELSELTLPDCDTCTDPSKRRSGVVFDGEFPGSVTPIYNCSNNRCKQKRNAIMLNFLCGGVTSAERLHIA